MMAETPTKKDKQRRRETLRPHPQRDQILDAMRSYGRPISPTQLARITENTIGSTAYHVRTLVQAGVIELADEGRVRGAVEHFYALVPGGDEASRLVDPVEQLLRLCDALTVPSASGGYPVPATLDDAARAKLRKVIAKLQPEVQGIVQAATKRVAASG
jgi:DNA-binding transcriptional ArsR family regulator